MRKKTNRKNEDLFSALQYILKSNDDCVENPLNSSLSLKRNSLDLNLYVGFFGSLSFDENFSSLENLLLKFAVPKE